MRIASRPVERRALCRDRRRPCGSRRHPLSLLHPGNEHPGLSNCTFTSYEQRQATASGRFLYCIANPYYVGEGDYPRAYGARAHLHRALTRLSAAIELHPAPYPANVN